MGSPKPVVEPVRPVQPGLCDCSLKGFRRLPDWGPHHGAREWLPGEGVNSPSLALCVSFIWLFLSLSFYDKPLIKEVNS